MIILHQSDIVNVVGEDNHEHFGTGHMIKRLESPDGGNVRYFVRWPQSTNGIIAGWYTTDDIIVAGMIYEPSAD